MGDGGIARDPGSLLEWWMGGDLLLEVRNALRSIGRKKKRMRKRRKQKQKGVEASNAPMFHVLSALVSASQRLRLVNLQ